MREIERRSRTLRRAVLAMRWYGRVQAGIAVGFLSLNLIAGSYLDAALFLLPLLFGLAMSTLSLQVTFRDDSTWDSDQEIGRG